METTQGILNVTTNLNRIGIIGAGFISDYHIKGLQDAGADVVAIASRTIESARAKAAQFGIAEATDDYREILNRDDIAAVVITTPDFTHRQLAIACAEAGKAILLQKPMARNSAECRDIIDVAKQNGTPLYVSFMHRYFEEVQRMRNLLAEDAFGRIFSIRQRNATPGADWAPWFFSRENVGGGAMVQLGVHGVDLIRYLFGEIEAVLATTALMKPERILADGTVVHPDNEDLMLATYRLASGAMVSHECGYNEVAGTDRFRMEVYGEAGTAWLRTLRGDLALYAPSYLGRDGWFSPTLPTTPMGLRQHRHFLNMLSGQAPPDSSAQDGLVTLLVCEAVYRSAESGTWEEVTQP